MFLECPGYQARWAMSMHVNNLRSTRSTMSFGNCTKLRSHKLHGCTKQCTQSTSCVNKRDSCLPIESRHCMQQQPCSSWQCTFFNNESRPSVAQVTSALCDNRNFTVPVYGFQAGSEQTCHPHSISTERTHVYTIMLSFLKVCTLQVLQDASCFMCTLCKQRAKRSWYFEYWGLLPHCCRLGVHRLIDLSPAWFFSIPVNLAFNVIKLYVSWDPYWLARTIMCCPEPQACSSWSEMLSSNHFHAPKPALPPRYCQCPLPATSWWGTCLAIGGGGGGGICSCTPEPGDPVDEELEVMTTLSAFPAIVGWELNAALPLLLAPACTMVRTASAWTTNCHSDLFCDSGLSKKSETSVLQNLSTSAFDASWRIPIAQYGQGIVLQSDAEAAPWSGAVAMAAQKC